MKARWSIISGLFLLLTAFVMETPVEKLLANLSKYTSSYPQEKVHLQTDKPYYAIGEDIWFKAYTVTAEKNEPSLLSAVLYVDLVNEKNEIRQKTTVSLNNGVGAGNLHLADSLASGKYRLRAYTNYMRNYDEGFFFEKSIQIGSVLDKTTETVEKEGSKKLSLQFFPEGGSMVSGIRGKVGVKAVTSDGLGANLEGYIVNKKEEKVAVFTTEHAGMGAFALTPQPGEEYAAVVILTSGERKTFRLPEVAASGYVLSVNKVGDNIKVQVSASQDLIKGQELSVITQANGVAYNYFTFKAEKAGFAANIPRKGLPTGIVHFTLFNAESQPVAERLVFVNNHDALNIEVQSTGNAGIKEKATLAFAVTDAAGNPAEGNFSVSVTDAAKVPVEEEEETTILSSLLLTSDLKGYIEQSNYYFINTDAAKERQLDNLLLTQGWSRFTWQDIAEGREPDISFRPEQTLEISGRVTNLYDKPLSKSQVTLISSTPGFPLMLDTITNAKGDFVFDRLDIPDSATFTIQAKGIKDGNEVKIFINERAGVTAKQIAGKSIDLMPYLAKTKELFVELDKRNMLGDGVLIKEVKVVAPKPFTRESVLNVKGSANAMGTADYVVSKKILERAFDIRSVFLRIPRLSGAGDNFLLILDGNPIPTSMNKDIIPTLNVKGIEGIEVLSSAYNTSVYGGGIVVFITMKKGADMLKTLPYAKLKNRGYTVVKEFYAPDYDDPKTSKDMQDLRTTIFWKPYLITDKEGKATLSYFNAGTPGTYRVTIEGIDAFGNLGRKVFTYEVKAGI